MNCHYTSIYYKYEIWIYSQYNEFWTWCFWHLNKIYFYFYLLINAFLVIDFPIKLMGWEILTFPWPGESSTLSHATLPWHGSFSRQKPGPETMETRGRWARVCKVATIVAVTFHSRIVCIVWCIVRKASKGFCMHLSRGHPILFRLVFFVPLYDRGCYLYLYLIPDCKTDSFEISRPYIVTLTVVNWSELALIDFNKNK